MAGVSRTAEVAQANFPTRFGRFAVHAFSDGNGNENIAVVKGTVRGKSGVLARIHSQCLTGDTMGSLRCDCRQQLECSLRLIGRKGGVLVYLNQEGRGIGLANKIKAYALQDKGLDTVEANKRLGFKADERSYEAASCILKLLGVRSVALLTNNPGKIKGLEKHGIRVAKRVSISVKPTRFNSHYLRTKKSKLHQLIDLGGSICKKTKNSSR